MSRTHVSSGTPWEPLIGYSRALRVGQWVFVSGTTATDSAGDVVGRDDPYLQTQQILRNIAWALEQVGGSLADVVRTRIYLTDISQWKEIGQAHGEAFGESRPATAMVQVAGLIAPTMLVEIEADAILGSDDVDD